MEKFRVISDLHIDYNYDYPLSLKKDGVFTLIAGDISGERKLVSVESSNVLVQPRIESDGEIMEHFETGSMKITYKTEDGKNVGHWVDSDGKRVSLLNLGIRIRNLDMAKNGDTITITRSSSSDWIRNNISKGIFIAGNHIVYNRDGKTIEELKEDYHKEFPESGDISFLDQSVGVMSKEVDGILFVCSTLYTNYEFPIDYPLSKGDSFKALNMRMATPKMSGGGMNDFNFGKTREGTYKREPWDDSDKFYLTPENYLRFFERTFSEIKRIVEENPSKDIVVMTHHCPSSKCISDEYVNDSMNASYVSELDDFIISHPQIKCWVCGHVHHRSSFKIGNCLCVMNPLGYCKHGQYKKNGGDWSPNVFVNTKTWEVEKEDYSNPDWDASLKRHEDLMMKYAGFFF